MSMDDCPRTDPPLAGDEKATLLGFLNYQRDTLLCKLSGLDDEQLRQPHVPSGLTLLGIVKHLTEVEREWFREVIGGEDLSRFRDPNDPQKNWRIKSDETTDAVVLGYRDEIARSDALILPGEVDLGGIVTEERPREAGMTLRWVVMHMIEETARHVGQADLIREAIDGATGE